jgi:DNA-binding Lrp family transcriptional regulator
MPNYRKTAEKQLMNTYARRRSDRELAKTVGVSQPTVTRVRQKLEREGIVREYTVVPDFSKLGFGIMAVMMFKLKALSAEELGELQRTARELDRQERRPYLLIMEGSGLGKNLIVIQFHKDYSDYVSYMNSMKERARSGDSAYMNLDSLEGFLIDLNYKNHYQPITLSRIAAHLQNIEKEKKKR